MACNLTTGRKVPCKSGVGGIRNVYFALLDEKTGAVISNGKFFDKNFLNHQVSYDYGMYAEESKKLLQDFFQQKR